MEIYIEKATKNELIDIVEILEERCRWLLDKGIHQWDNNYAKLYNSTYYEDHIQNELVYVAKIEDRVVGSMALLKDQDGGVTLRHLNTSIREKGVGKALVQFAISNYKDMGDKLFLNCVKRNPFLNEYYKSLGFKKIGEDERVNMYIFDEVV